MKKYYDIETEEPKLEIGAWPNHEARGIPQIEEKMVWAAYDHI